METNNTGKRIAQLRKKNGWSQATLAAKLNVSDKSVSKWENGGMPSVDLFPELSRIFNVSIDYLLLGDQDHKEAELDSDTDELSQESDKMQDDLDIEALSIQDIELILNDQRELYTEEELELLEHRLQELNGTLSAQNEEELPTVLVCPKCGVRIEDETQTHCEYCMCDLSKHPLIMEYLEDEEDEEDTTRSSARKVKHQDSIGCIGYLVAFIIPIAGLIWGIIRKDHGVVVFSVIMLILNFIASFYVNTIISMLF